MTKEKFQFKKNFKYKLIRFDLDQAIDGFPVATRSQEHEVTNIEYIKDTPTDKRYPVLAQISCAKNGCIFKGVISTTKIGKHWGDHKESIFDLFMIDLQASPFDLEKANAGHPLITRNGHEVKTFSAVLGQPDNLFNVTIKNVPIIFTVDENGFCVGLNASVPKDQFDLFLYHPQIKKQK